MSFHSRPTGRMMTVAWLLIFASLAAPAVAAPGEWGASRSDRDAGSWRDRSDLDRLRDRGPSSDSREGRVEVIRFVGPGDAAALLGHGRIELSAAPDSVDATASAPFEAAVIDRLAAAGYDTLNRPRGDGQRIELRIVRNEVAPSEVPRRPVSGAMEMGVSNRGSDIGIALNVDLRKPRGALDSTRLEARILDAASGRALWEGRAEIATRRGADRWSDQAVAGKLADALFDGFPGASGETRVLR